MRWTSPYVGLALLFLILALPEIVRFLWSGRQEPGDPPARDCYLYDHIWYAIKRQRWNPYIKPRPPYAPVPTRDDCKRMMRFTLSGGGVTRKAA